MEKLTQVKGIGRWTAQMFLIFSLGRPDVFPHDDLGVRKVQSAGRGEAVPYPFDALSEYLEYVTADYSWWPERGRARPCRNGTTDARRKNPLGARR